MKINLILIFVFLPLISFAQLTTEEKSTIDNYAANICKCINGVFETLGPKTYEMMIIMANEGEEVAIKQIEEYIIAASEEDANKLLESFNSMGSIEFQNKIEKCDNKEGMSSEMLFSIDNEKGEYSDYFYNYLANTIECNLSNYLMLLGTQVEENEK
ncbi:MAG: hypothetical protein QM499_01460 [Flavobacteriaceae bacterium]